MYLMVSLIFILIGIPVMLIVFKLINDLEVGLKYEAIKTYQDLKTSNHLQKINLNIYQQLDEGILTIKNGKIDFTNQIAENILMDLDSPNSQTFTIDEIKKNINDAKILKIYKLNESLEKRQRSIFMNSRKLAHKLSSGSHIYEKYEIGQTFSINEILKKPESFFQDKIFEIVYNYNSYDYSN